MLASLPLAGAALGLALLAQQLLAERVLPLDGALVYLLAALLWFGALSLARPGYTEPDFWRAGAQPSASRLASTGHLLPAGVFAVLAWLLLESDSFTRGGAVAWLASLAFLTRAVVDPPAHWLGRLRGWFARLVVEGWRPRLGVHHLLVVAILLIAVFFRVYQLPLVPAEVTSDHVEKLLDVRGVLQGQTPLFFPRNTGREPLEFYLAALVAQATGLSHLTLQLVTIAASVAAVFATYHLGRELLSAHFGLLAAALMAVSRWDVTLARMGLRFSLSTLFTALALLFLLRAMRTQRLGEYLVCGLFLGLGLLGYSNFRVVPLLVALLFVLGLLLRGALEPRNWRSLLAGLGVTSAAAALVSLPLARFAVAQPELFWQRTDTRLSSFGGSPAEALAVLVDNLKDALLMFNWRGDVGWVHNLPNSPALDPLTAALFALGAAYLLVRFARRREYWSGALLVALPVLLLPTALSLVHPLENPSFNRASTAIPLVFLIAAIVPGMAWELARRLLPGWRGLVAGGALLLVLVPVAAAQNFGLYFGDFARSYRQAVPNSSEIASVAQGYSAALGGAQRVFILSYPHWVDHRAVGLHMGDLTWNNVLMPEQVSAHREGAGGAVYLVHPADAHGFAELQRLHPVGHLLHYTSAVPGKDFLVYLVPD